MLDQDPTGRKRVLVVDDDLQLALTFQALLETQGHEAATADNGITALKWVAHTEPDAIVCDLNMPEMDGELFYLEIARIRPHLLKRFIFVTGNAGEPQNQDFLKKAKAPVLDKPASFAQLLEAIQQVTAA